MQKITFWELISSPDIKKICIPTIQRDYALGRRNKVDKRGSFLEALKKAVCTKEQLPLDFVYGVDNDTMFVPLDGQQRLTTLWLLHWYIAYKAGILENHKEVFLKFSYETRISSTDFCKALCGLRPIPYVEKSTRMSIRTWIMQQTWFFHQYKQDPTIMGMLNMIAGTDISNDKGEDIIDGLDESFSDKEYDFPNLWKNLTTSHCIVFHKLKISLNDSDELYVKMNARGKQLTDFENFKTELVQHTKDSGILNEIEALNFAAKLDVQWTDIFWQNRWKDEKTKDISIDEIYFAFVRRYVRLECLKKFDDKSPLTGKITRKFTNFSAYKVILDKESIYDFIKIMDNLRGIVFRSESSWGDSFDFIPRYINNNKKDITELNNTQLLMFYGCCRYLLNGTFDEETFSQWNRVLWNICENRVDKNHSKPTMNEIDILAPYSHNIAEYLSQEKEIKCDYNKDQLKEEQRKARHLSTYPQIIEMEGYLFFKGAIRFLYTGANNEEDWNSFTNKANNIKILIPESGRHTIKHLTPYIEEHSLKDIYNQTHRASNNDTDLRGILLDDASIPFIHHFLLQEKPSIPLSHLHKDIIDLCENAFWGRGYLQTGWDESKFIWTRFQKRSGYYNWGGSYIIGNDAQQRILGILKSDFEVYSDMIKHEFTIGNHFPFLFIYFTYNQHFWTLYSNNTICLMTDNWEKKMENPMDSNGYYFKIETIYTKEQLIDQLQSILSVHMS